MRNGLGLGDAYDATIGRIKAREGDEARLGMDALMWISHSERPLNVDEICHALAVEIGSTGINTNNVPSIRTVLSCCQGLASVDKGSSTIRLIHSTLTEYLTRHADLFDKPHSKIAETCLTYLNFQAVKDLSAHRSYDLRGTPFLRYSSLHWGTHMRMELSDRSRCLALDLLDQYDNHISAELLWESTVFQRFNDFEPFSGLHCVSYFGIAASAIDMIRTKRWDVNQRDNAGLTPLMWAAMHGRQEVVKVLLKQKRTQPDMPDAGHGKTALAWAAEGGYEEVVRLFLGPLFINPGRIGRMRGIPRVMRVLFGRKYVNPNRPDFDGRTPLSWAATGGHDGVVKLLLGREDVSPDRPGDYGQTPLSLAAWNGHDRVVKLLLGREEVSPDRPDNDGRTPLSLAACNGNDGVVKLLLGREDVSPDRLHNYGRTPLSWAAENRHGGVVKLLLRREDVNPDRPDNNGRTPLSWAAGGRTLSPWAKSWNNEVVELLLEREDVNPDRADKGGRTPLLWAAKNGCDGAVGLLLAREDVTPDRSDNDGRTPLWWAILNGHNRVVRLLPGWEDVSPYKLAYNRRMPRSWVPWNGRRGSAAPPATWMAVASNMI